MFKRHYLTEYLIEAEKVMIYQCPFILDSCKQKSDPWPSCTKLVSPCFALLHIQVLMTLVVAFVHRTRIIAVMGQDVLYSYSYVGNFTSYDYLFVKGFILVCP